MYKLTDVFVDRIGRASDKPFSQEDGLSDNPLLISGELLFLKNILGTITEQDKLFAKQILEWSQVEPGLFRRHPEFFQKEHNIPYHNTSHDEQLGICLIDYTLNNGRKITEYGTYCQDMVHYGHKYNWMFYDLVPKSDFYKYYYSDPVKATKELYAYYKDWKNSPNDTNSVDFRHNPNISALSGIRQPRDRALYKMCAGQNPGFIGAAWLSLAIIISSTGKLDDGSRGGTMLLAWFRMQLMNMLEKQNWLVNLAHKYFNYKLTKRFGEGYPTLIADKYFDRVGPNGERHPIISLIWSYLA